MPTLTPAQRILRKDAAFWSADVNAQEKIQNRLGWLDVMAYSRSQLDAVKELVTGVRQRGLQRVLLLGMGGSFLAPEVFSRVAGPQPGYPKMITLDSTSPDQILGVRADINPRDTLVVVSSKSGGTIETLSLYRYFYQVYKNAGISDPASHFVAITDPSSALHREAEEKGFLGCFLNSPDIGGRFSALSLFGLAPAALLGVDVDAVLDAATEARYSCVEGTGEGVMLGEWLAAGWRAGRDKLGLVLPPRFHALGWWIEQLVAESLGKDGKGFLPYLCDDREKMDRPDGMCVVWGAGEQPVDEKEAWIRNLETGDTVELGRHFFNWEFATALAGGLMGVNPFDEPDVAEAKRNTTRLLEEGSIQKRLSGVVTSTGVREFLGTAGQGDYVAILAYLPQEPGKTVDRLEAFRHDVEGITGLPVTLCRGPRYLHSVGQYHKGGPDKGLFLIIVDDANTELPVPGASYDFGTLLSAQALGDFQALKKKGRRVVLITEAAIPIPLLDTSVVTPAP
jgi:transaldolase/glucose-6-phosphate isomerase